MIGIMGKFGSIKRQHGRIEGLDALMDELIRDCPHISRIVPGRMGRKQGRTGAQLRIQYATATGPSATGLKCIYGKAGSWQEVFLVCRDAAAAEAWLIGRGLVVQSGKPKKGKVRKTNKVRWTREERD